MLIIPAIDIIEGKVVRLVQGRRDKKIYSNDPVKTVKHWERQGAELIHVVDLEGATTGVPKNLKFVKEMIKNINVPLQFGGGVRNIKTIASLLDSGIWRVVLGTKAAEDTAFLKKAFKTFKKKIIVSIDALGSQLMVRGWRVSCKKINALDFAHTLKEIGFQQIIFTDTSKDGTLKGPNVREIKKLFKETKLKVIASGGISSLDDLYKLKLLEKQGLAGVIVGKALYEGEFTLRQALKFS